jgi:hypothetical protein
MGLVAIENMHFRSLLPETAAPFGDVRENDGYQVIPEDSGSDEGFEAGIPANMS